LTLALDGHIVVSNSAPLAFTAAPGSHTLQDSRGATGTLLRFSVDADGTVSYDPSFQGIFTGAGTSTLTVAGVTVTLDTTHLSLIDLQLDNSLAVGNTAPFVFTTLPG